MDSSILIQIAQLALGLAALIIIHEFGHFAAARLFKIPVEEFGLGFPPRVATLFTAGGTKFTLNLLPIVVLYDPKVRMIRTSWMGWQLQIRGNGSGY